jgi:hypothetical protein
MTYKRKTLKVEKLRETVNSILADSAPHMIRERVCAAMILEEVLMDTGNYKGFGYVDISDARHPDFDDSRRVYYGG